MTDSKIIIRQRFEKWFKDTYPLWKNDSDTTLKHKLWTAWQMASLSAESPTEQLVSDRAGLRGPHVG